MQVLSSRILLRPTNLARSREFYRDVLGLGIYREFGPGDNPGTVFFLGNGLLEVSGETEAFDAQDIALWLQVTDVTTDYAGAIERGATPLREPLMEPWGLHEAWIADPDGVRIVLVEVPENHPLRRDDR